MLSANQRRLCSNFFGRNRICPRRLTSLVASPRASCHEKRNLLLHGDNAPKHNLTGLAPAYLQDLLKRLDGGWHCMARVLDRTSVVTHTGLCNPSLVSGDSQVDVATSHRASLPCFHERSSCLRRRFGRCNFGWTSTQPQTTRSPYTPHGDSG